VAFDFAKLGLVDGLVVDVDAVPPWLVVRGSMGSMDST
jgi:hypothetical protein